MRNDKSCPTLNSVESDLKTTPEENAKLWKSGDNDQLFERNLPLVKALSISFSRSTGEPTHDLFQEGAMALRRAVEQYNGSSAFSTYAYAAIKNAMIRHAKYMRYGVKKVSQQVLDDPPRFTGIEGAAEMIEDESQSDITEKLSNLTEIEQILDGLRRSERLSPVDLYIFFAHRGEGVSMRFIGRLLGVSGEEARRRERRVWQVLRNITCGRATRPVSSSKSRLPSSPPCRLSAAP